MMFARLEIKLKGNVVNAIKQKLSPRSLAAAASRQEHQHGITCTADVQFTESELEILNSDSRALFTKLPFDGPGYECYGYDNDGQHHYGRSSTIQAIVHICEQWAKKHPNAPRIGVGDISLPNGGDTPRHASHEEGVDVDFSLVTNNGREEPSNWRAGNYSRELTQAFISLITNNPVLPPRVILFNDGNVKGVQYHAGHDDHIHVRFQLGPNVAAPTFTPSDTGYLKLVSPYMQGQRVEEVQAMLVKAGVAVDVDGVFGIDTERAVKAFQEKAGVNVSGVVDEDTLPLLLTASNA